MPQGSHPKVTWATEPPHFHRLRQSPKGLIENKTVSSHLLLEDILKALRGCARWQEDLNVPVLPVDRLSPPSRLQLCPGQSW